jgi:squalene-associated FAD-dependent desaturase
MRVAVVGAGLAGLSAALACKDAGAQVEVFERSRLLGGRATSFEIDGIEVDNGQHVFLACCSAFIGFAQRTGMEGFLRLQPRFEALVLSRGGRAGCLRAAPLPAPLHLLASFARYPHLSLAGRLRVARALAGAMREGPAGGGTFERWLQCMGQNEETRRGFWDPFFIPALNAPFDRVGVEDALFTLRTAFLEGAGAARFGFSTVPLARFAAAAAAELDAVHLCAGVAGVATDGAGVVLTLSKGEERRRFDAVVLAVPPRMAGKLLGDPQAYGVQNLDRYDSYPILDVHLWHDAGGAGFDFAAALDSPLQWIFEKSPGYLCCSFSSAQEHMQRPTAELQEFAWREVQGFVPALAAAKLVRSAVTRNPEATWLARVGSQRTPHRTLHPGIAVAGSWTATGWPDTMESAVRSGIGAARILQGVRRGGELLGV